MSGQKDSTTSETRKSTGVTLNAEAQEWYPANHYAVAPSPSQGARYSAQNRLRQYQHEGRGGGGGGRADGDFEYLQGMIARITSDPGQFEEVIDTFMQTLSLHYHTNEMMVKICDFIVGHAINEPSFRYNAARLCVLIQEDTLLFRQRLEDVCLREVEKNRQRPGFTLFLAELYTQSKMGNWKMLYDALNKLISLGGDENIKTVCQTLKLSGYSLETFNKYMMEDLIKALEGKKPFVQKNINSLIEVVVNLKTNKWGYNASSSSSSSSSSSHNVPNGFAAQSVPCYDPCNDELTEAEQCFMEGELEDDPDGLYDPEPEMDEEIQAAFKEFVKMSK